MAKGYKCDICGEFFDEEPEMERLTIKVGDKECTVRLVLYVRQSLQPGQPFPTERLDLCATHREMAFRSYLDKLGIEPPSPSATEAG